MRIEALELSTGDLEGQRAFYGEKLGFPTTDDGEGTLRVQAGASRLVFRHRPVFGGAYHFAFNVPPAKIAASERFLRKSGIVPIADADGKTRIVFESWGAESVYFRDPTGNILEFIGRREIEEPLADPETFSSADVTNVSEGGLVSADVAKTAEMLAKTLGLAAYRDASATFSALGDAHGLLILVPPGRIWFPDTGVPAEILPSCATVETTNGRWAISTAPLRIHRL